MVSFVLGHLEEDGQRPVTPSMHWVQWLFPGLTASESRRGGHVRECVCAKWVGKYTVPPIFAKCVQVIPKNTVCTFYFDRFKPIRVFILNMLNILLDLGIEIPI